MSAALCCRQTQHGYGRMAKKDTLPLNEIMRALDTKNRDWYNNLDAEKKKKFSAWMMMRYSSSVQGPFADFYLDMTNELINKDFSAISKHPELQWLLFTAVGIGQTQRHEYVKPSNSRKKKDKVREFMGDQLPHLKADEIELLLAINTKEELEEFAQSHGLGAKEIKEIFK